MKKFFPFSLLVIILFNIACKKDENNPAAPPTPVPQIPSLSEPADSSIDVVTNPTLVWFVIEDAESYALQISTIKTFETVQFAENGIVPTQKQITGLANLKDYYWRVRSVNKNGASGWSTIRTFTTTLGSAPQAPTALYPTETDTGISLTPKMRWTGVSGAVSYSVRISSSSAFTTIKDSATIYKDTIYTSKLLDSSRSYCWQVAAKNRYGSSQWSATKVFATLSPLPPFVCGASTVLYVGKQYNTVLIGSQCWLKENLNVGVYVPSTNTGSTHSDVSNNGIIEKYCYGNIEANCNTFGGLYDWNEAMGYVTTAGARGICPPGWHIPTNAEFQTLSSAVGNNSNALKAQGQGTGSGTGTNSSGFSALLAGYRFIVGSFSNVGNYTFYWSSSEYSTGYARYLNLYYHDSYIYFSDYLKEFGFSVRCAKD